LADPRPADCRTALWTVRPTGGCRATCCGSSSSHLDWADGHATHPPGARRHRQPEAARSACHRPPAARIRGRDREPAEGYRDAIGPEAASLVTGGQSFGGRVASLLAAEEPPAALVLFAYPLHAPGRHDAWVERTAHWPRIACPVLLLSGESDPFARIDLLREAVGQLPRATLRTYPGVGHGVAPVLDEALDEAAAFIRSNT
jgi:pimeloyl-ACP methyl ester carboxylesterase